MLESELGDKLIEYCKANEIHYVPEYKGWDLVAEYRNIIFGIQLKLDLNTKAISQCLLNGGVDFKLIIFCNKTSKKKQDELFPILNCCKIIPIFYSGTFGLHPRLQYSYPKFNLLRYRYHPKKRIELPQYNFNIPSGSRSPLNISDWKIAVIKLELLADQNGGWVYKSDFQKYGLRNTPRQYFCFVGDKKWKMQVRPSRDFPYILEAIQKGHSH